MARTRSKPHRRALLKTEPKTPEVIFEYIKGQNFRVVHADGAIGGVTPGGNIHMAFYSERSAIPRLMVHEVTADGALGALKPEKTVSRAGIVREMDVDVVMSEAGIDALLAWLAQKKADLIQRKKKLAALARRRKLRK